MSNEATTPTTEELQAELDRTRQQLRTVQTRAAKAEKERGELMNQLDAVQDQAALFRAAAGKPFNPAYQIDDVLTLAANYIQNDPVGKILPPDVALDKFLRDHPVYAGGAVAGKGGADQAKAETLPPGWDTDKQIYLGLTPTQRELARAERGVKPPSGPFFKPKAEPGTAPAPAAPVASDPALRGTARPLPAVVVSGNPRAGN